jgi:hypothetical protein
MKMKKKIQRKFNIINTVYKVYKTDASCIKSLLYHGCSTNYLKTNRREFRIAHSNAMRTLRRYRLMLTSWREALVEIFQTHFGGE